MSSAAGTGAKAEAAISVCFMTDTFNIFRLVGKLTQGASNSFRRRRYLPDLLSCGCIAKATGAQNASSIIPVCGQVERLHNAKPAYGRGSPALLNNTN
jgi:hypothetical protein